MEHVIVGCGPAGVIAAETLREHAPESGITLLGDEPEAPYSRMALPYLLTGRIAEDGTHLRKENGYFENLAIKVVQGRVKRVDAKGGKAVTEDGKDLSFDRLLVATGSRALIPPIPGIEHDAVHPCWTLADARAIAQLAGKESRVVLMGAGFIGCIILEALAKRDVELTVVEMGKSMVPRMMTEAAGSMLKKWCENKGVSIKTSTKITAIEEGKKGAPALVVNLDKGAPLEADLVIVAAGVQPNTEFLEDSGVEADGGILVDRFMASNVPGIYAAGDVARGRDFSTGEYSVHAIQPTAAEHGRVAALNMAGIETPYGGSLNMNVLDTMGLVSSSFGMWMGVKSGDQAELCDSENFRYINLQFEDDILVGASSLGLTQHVGVLHGLIQSRTRLGRWKDTLLENPSRFTEAYLGSTHPLG